MKLINPIAIKRLAECAVGELVALSRDDADRPDYCVTKVAEFYWLSFATLAINRHTTALLTAIPCACHLALIGFSKLYRRTKCPRKGALLKFPAL